MKLTLKHSMLSCYTGYVVQAIVNTLPPLFYAFFNRSLGITMEQLGLIATLNFCVQIATDFASAFFVDRFGYRKSCILAHGLSSLGLIALGILPNLLPDAYLGILIATVLTAVGGGLIEVVVSPMIEAMPTQNKGRQMAILHSFYCWGECAVVLFSTLFFALAGIDAWFILPFAWAIVPFSNIFLLCGIPLYELPKEAKDGSTVVGMLKSPLFWVMAAMMVASGASELCMCTWASIFAEVGLGVDKSVGDLLGPFLFALLMGIGRVVSAKLTTRVPVEKCLFVSALGCTACYFSTVFFGSAIISLLSCATSGFFVALMWPGTYSLGASRISCGGTKMFALFALGGDIGCSLGSYVTGRVSDLVNSGKWSFFTSFLPAAGTGIRAGILVSSLFPVLMIIGSLLVMRTGKKRQRMSE